MAKSAIRRIIDDKEASRKTLRRLDDFLEELLEHEVLNSRQVATARKLIETEREAHAERKRLEESRRRRTYNGILPKRKK